MAKSHREIFQHTSQRLLDEARFAGILNNPGAVGEARELALKNVIEPLLGATFAVAKGELVDAHGATTPEYDAVIYDATTGGPLCHVGERAVLRVESVGVIIEIKSTLRADQGSKILQNFSAMWPLRRHYKAGVLASVLGGLNTADQRKLKTEGVAANHRYQGISPIATAVFAFDGPEVDTAHSYFQMPGVDIVCVLGKYAFAVAGGVYPYAFKLGQGDDALGAFCSLIEEQMYVCAMSRSYAVPDLGQYFIRGAYPGAQRDG